MVVQAIRADFGHADHALTQVLDKIVRCLRGALAGAIADDPPVWDRCSLPFCGLRLWPM